VSNVLSMVGVFSNASAFNQDISIWNVSNVTTMDTMFSNASSFNQDIGAWDVGNVVNMRGMLQLASSFDQDLGSWAISSSNNLNGMLFDVTLSTANYDSLLIGWSSQALPNNTNFLVGNSQYCTGGTARQSIINDFGWNITDGGLETENVFYADIDEDGFGDANNSIIACIAPAGFVSNNTDCDDLNAAINPNALEICDGIDNNCDGIIDEGVKTTFYADTDNDGFGDPNNSLEACELPTGYLLDNTDCDDTNASVNTNAVEVPDNGLDDDCDPSTPDCVADDDNDGTPNCFDSCPKDKNKIEPGDCGCGVKDTDKDGDGIADCIDVCKGQDDSLDTDGDGVPDCIDVCDGQDDNLDTDGDGLADCLDICPNDPNNTCPANSCAPGNILVCHVSKKGSQELCINAKQLQKHLDHGDVVGPCNSGQNITKLANNEIKFKGLNIFPNPASNLIHIQSSLEINSITMINVLGEKVMVLKGDTKTIYFERIANGLYFIKFSTSKGEIIKRVIINK
jgi:surface protein